MVASIGTVSAQNETEGRDLDLKIFFDINNAKVDKYYSENLSTFSTLDSVLKNNEIVEKINSIQIFASASIDGMYTLNKRLSDKRIASVRDFLTQRYPNVPSSTFEYVSLGENWAELRQYVYRDPKMPYKEEVLAVIDNRSSYDDKELQFKNIGYGAAWDYMKTNIFPFQRYGVGVIFVPKDANTYILASKAPKEAEELEELEEVEEVAEEATPAEKPQTKFKVRYPSDMTSDNNSPLFTVALKTNLLADVLTALNVEIEVPIGERFSVSGEWMFPWWRGVKSDFTVQIMSAQFEGKYWFGDRSSDNLLLGWSAGVFGGLGTYDIQPFTQSGASGDFFDIGIIGGYAHEIAENLHLEYEVGLGYFHSDYRIYDMETVGSYGYIKEVRDGFDKRKYDMVLPARLKVSLVWMLSIL